MLSSIVGYELEYCANFQPVRRIIVPWIGVGAYFSVVSLLVLREEDVSCFAIRD